MEHVIRHVLIRISQYLVHYHQRPYHTVIFVHHQIVQHPIVMNIVATMPIFIIMILKFDNCILKAFDFRALQIELSVCVRCAFQFPVLTLSMLLFFFLTRLFICCSMGKYILMIQFSLYIRIISLIMTKKINSWSKKTTTLNREKHIHVQNA